MKNKLGQLLNSLIEAGWEPRGYKMHGINCSGNRFTLYLPNMRHGDYSIRDLVSKESGLWQFVCKNKLYDWQVYVWLTNTEGFHDEFGDSDYQFRLIESALKDESELEEFLLSNIKL